MSENPPPISSHRSLEDILKDFPESHPKYRNGATVAVKRSNDAIDTTGVVQGYNPNTGKVCVVFPNGDSKVVTIGSLDRVQESLAAAAAQAEPKPVHKESLAAPAAQAEPKPVHKESLAAPAAQAEPEPVHKKARIKLRSAINNLLAHIASISSKVRAEISNWSQARKDKEALRGVERERRKEILLTRTDTFTIVHGMRISLEASNKDRSGFDCDFTINLNGEPYRVQEFVEGHSYMIKIHIEQYEHPDKLMTFPYGAGEFYSILNKATGQREEVHVLATPRGFVVAGHDIEPTKYGLIQKAPDKDEDEDDRWG